MLGNSIGLMYIFTSFDNQPWKYLGRYVYMYLGTYTMYDKYTIWGFVDYSNQLDPEMI